VAPDTVSALVPRTILPTIAEHLVRRANDESNDGPRVIVRAARHDETLRLEMTIAAREQGAIGEWSDEELALDSVRDQLQRLYGRSQSIELVSRDTGVVAVMHIPFRESLMGELENSGT